MGLFEWWTVPRFCVSFGIWLVCYFHKGNLPLKECINGVSTHPKKLTHWILEQIMEALIEGTLWPPCWYHGFVPLFSLVSIEPRLGKKHCKSKEPVLLKIAIQVPGSLRKQSTEILWSLKEKCLPLKWRAIQKRRTDSLKETSEALRLNNQTDLWKRHKGNKLQWVNKELLCYRECYRASHNPEHVRGWRPLCSVRWQLWVQPG